MNAEKLTFELKDVIKLIGFVAVVCGMWFDLKSDLREFKATTELRISQLEKENDKAHFRGQQYAIVPNETRLKDERQ
jgi:hypothetical protein